VLQRLQKSDRLTRPSGISTEYSEGRPRMNRRASLRAIKERAKLAPVWRWQSVQWHTP
jgi:hypothetical protein